MALAKEQKIRLYTNLVRVRKLDGRMVQALLSGKLSPFFHSQHGQEAVGVGACTFLREDDYLVYDHRGHGISKLVPKGLSIRGILAEHYGKATGCCSGMGVYHTAAPELGIPGISGTIGGAYVLASGMGIAAQMRGKGQVVVCTQGEGSIGRGTFHEAGLMAANWKLPVIWIIENNRYMGFTPVSDLHPKEDIADLAFGYGIPGVVVDGQDVAAVFEATQTAVDRAREGQGPSLIECKTYRIRSHAEGVPDWKIATPRPQEEIEAWAKRDPIELFNRRLLEEGVLTQAEVDRIDREATEELEDADRLATADPLPDPAVLAGATYATPTGGRG